MKKFLVLLSACLLVLSVYPQCPDINNDVVFINEIHYNNIGADVNEGVEIAGPAGTNLAGYSLVFYNGADDLSYYTEPLAGVIPNLAAGFGTIWFPIANIQNGSLDGVALYNGNTLTLVQFLSYGGTMTAANDVAAGTTSEDIGVSEDNTTPIGSSLQLVGGPGNCPSDFSWSGPVTGLGASGSAINTGQTFVAAGTCLLTGLNITQTACVDFFGTQVATIEIDFNAYNVPGANFQLAVSPDPSVPTPHSTQYAYTSLPITLTNYVNGVPYTFVVSDPTDPTCQNAFLINQTFSCPTATMLSFTDEPVDCIEPGTAFEVTVCAVDALGGVQTNYGSTISITGFPGGTLTGTTSLIPIDGCATFTLTSTIPQSLSLTATDGAGPLTDGTSNQIDVVADCPAVEFISGVLNPCGDDSQNEFLAASTGAAPVNVADMIFASIDPMAGTQPNVNYTWSADGDEVAGSTTESCGTIGLQCNQILDINDPTDGPIIGNLILQLNAQAGCTLFEAPTGGAGTLGTIPANRDFVFFLGAGGNPGTILPGFNNLAANLDFSGFCVPSQTVYAIFGYHDNPSTTLGFFSNTASRTYQVIVNGNNTSNLNYSTPTGGVEAEYALAGSPASQYFFNQGCVPVDIFGQTPLTPDFLEMNGQWTPVGLADLEWVISETQGVSDFVVERMEQGEFVSGKEIPAIPDVLAYTTQDVPSSGITTTYRIRMNLNDGTHLYSKQVELVSLRPAELELLAVYPNPSQGSVHFSINSPDRDVLHLQVSALDGRQLLTERWKLQPGQTQVSAELTQLPAGLYVYRLESLHTQHSGLLRIE